jgi:hypothetical protein
LTQVTAGELRAQVQPGGGHGGQPPRVPLPPHTGALAIGGEEETRHNAGQIIPNYKTPRDFKTWHQLGGKALRFSARMDPATVGPDDARRRFNISFYFEDSTLAIAELVAAAKGGAPATVKRFLNRGRYRNAAAGPDAAATAAMSVKRPASASHGVLAPAVAEAYERVFGASGDKYGYAHGFGGQGYGGGLYGQAEHAGAGGTGSPCELERRRGKPVLVEYQLRCGFSFLTLLLLFPFVTASADMGVRTGEGSAGTLTPPARFVDASDLTPGATLILAHMPGLHFIIEQPDAFTAAFLAAQARVFRGRRARLLPRCSPFLPAPSPPAGWQWRSVPTRRLRP